MQLTAIFTTVLVAMTSMVSAQTAVVHNDCTFKVFLQSFPYDGSPAGPFTVLQPGSTYTEAYRDGGSSIKLSKKRTLSTPLFSAYTNEKSQVFYSLETKFGNPFIAFRNKLVPSSIQCQRFNCAPNAASCYSNNGSKVFQCAKPVNLTTTLCA